MGEIRKLSVDEFGSASIMAIDMLSQSIVIVIKINCLTKWVVKI
jgi:hypothetical protein